MSQDEFIYLLMLIISMPLGYVIQRRAATPNRKKWICTGAGLGMVAVVCRMNTFHSLVTTFVNSLIIKFSNKRYCPTLSFVFVFTYLAFFRTTHYFGLPAPTSFSNVVQLLLTLRMVGISFEVQDSWKAKEKIAKSEKEEVDNRTLMAVIDTPRMIDVFMYAYCYIGILTGPYYKYKVYADMINQKPDANIPTFKPAVHRLKYIIPYGGAYLILSQYFIIDYLRTDEFYDNPFWYRYLFMVPMFIVFRLRMFSAWVLSEVVCILAGLGAYPKETNPKCAQGPTQPVPQDNESNYEYNFDTIRNIDGYNCDTTSTLRDAMRFWNMTVQWWLKHYIYIRCPIKSLRTSITLLVSAFWHGIHPGYFLSFLTIPIMLMAEDVMIRAFRTDENASVYRKLNWFFRSRGLDYLAMGFLLLTWNDTIRFWKSVYFIPHIFSALFIIVGLVFQPKPSHRKLKETKESTEQASDSIGKKTD